MSNAIRYFKALSDETRLRLTYVLERYELSVNELVSILEMGQSRVSRHLKILTEAGLLSSRRDGLWVFYSSVKDVEMAARIIEDRALKTRQFFNTIAEHWDTLSREVLGGFDLAGAVCDTMPEGCDTSVDLGCGTGIVLERMRGRARQIIGVDGSPRMLELSRRRLAGVEGEPEGVSLRIGELSHLPLRDCEADFASINMVLHHLSNPENALAEIRRVLRSGGLLVVADFDRHTQERMRLDYGDLWLGFDEATMARLLHAASFEVVSTTRYPVEQGLALNLTLARRL